MGSFGPAQGKALAHCTRILHALRPMLQKTLFVQFIIQSPRPGTCAYTTSPVTPGPFGYRAAVVLNAIL